MKTTNALILFAVWFYSLTCFSGTRRVEVIQSYTPTLSEGSGDLYVPVPEDKTGYQKVLSQKFAGNAAWVKNEIVRLDEKGAIAVPVLHAHWDKAVTPELRVTDVVELQDRNGVLKDASSPKYFLKATPHVQTDGIVAQKALEITKGLKTPDEKARAIYDWIVDHTLRDPATRGCGLGDVKTTLSSGNLRGKCADLNSLFVGLSRAAGIPAREVWGIRVAPSNWQKILGKEGDVSKAQHCRAEYYSETKKGWIPVDPADIQKLVVDGKLTLRDPELVNMREKLFGNWEGNWVALNSGRDFKLPGLAKDINYFMYPKLVSHDVSPDGMVPAEVSYVITSKVLAGR